MCICMCVCTLLMNRCITYVSFTQEILSCTNEAISSEILALGQWGHDQQLILYHIVGCRHASNIQCRSWNIASLDMILGAWLDSTPGSMILFTGFHHGASHGEWTLFGSALLTTLHGNGLIVSEPAGGCSDDVWCICNYDSHQSPWHVGWYEVWVAIHVYIYIHIYIYIYVYIYICKLIICMIAESIWYTSQQTHVCCVASISAAWQRRSQLPGADDPAGVSDGSLKSYGYQRFMDHHIYTYTYICIYTCICGCMYIHIYTSIYLHIYILLSVVVLLCSSQWWSSSMGLAGVEG